MKRFKHYLLLLLTAAIWGFAFVAQRIGNKHLDPFLFNGLRFGLGALCVALIALVTQHSSLRISKEGLLLGLVLFVASALQQMGLIWTSAGAAGFITGLYIVFVPIFGLLRKQKTSPLLWIAIMLSLGGLLCLNDFGDLKVSAANLLVLCGAVFWAIHVQLIDKYRQNSGTLDLALSQYLIAAGLSLAVSLISRLLPGAQPYSLDSIASALPALLYGGVMSVGVAFSLQAYAQKEVAPTAAALILSTEGVFALLGGYLILTESIGLPALIGSALIALGTILALVSQPKLNPA